MKLDTMTGWMQRRAADRGGAVPKSARAAEVGRPAVLQTVGSRRDTYTRPEIRVAVHAADAVTFNEQQTELSLAHLVRACQDDRVPTEAMGLRLTAHDKDTATLQYQGHTIVLRQSGREVRARASLQNVRQSQQQAQQAVMDRAVRTALKRAIQATTAMHTVDFVDSEPAFAGQRVEWQFNPQTQVLEMRPVKATLEGHTTRTAQKNQYRAQFATPVKAKQARRSLATRTQSRQRVRLD